VTISSLAGFVMASTGGVDGWTLFWAMIGIPLTSAGGCALNQVLEVELDARMKRTANRPLPSGRIDVSHATWFAVGLIAAGVGILCPLTNPLTGVMAAMTVALYIWVYTPLKRKSTWNTLVGTIPGALPILGGWTAASGDVGAGGWALFGVLLCWQMPHFFALAWMYRKDYGESPFLMLPSGDEQGTRTALQMIVFSVLMIVFSVLPVSLGLSGMAYLVGALLLGGWFMVHVGRFWLTRSVQHARAVLKGSVMYIPLLLMAIILDRLLFVI
jgi:protoheme IX farnesyltransferase